nr:MAG TPA: hypothetical protein [Bacteriophage sp.]
MFFRSEKVNIIVLFSLLKSKIFKIISEHIYNING